jgi:DDE superfamily endonuclease
MGASLRPGRAPGPALEGRMLRYPRLSRSPKVFRALTGLSVPEFDALVGDVLPALADADRARLSRPGRQRALGGGRRAALAPRDQVLLQVVWLRRYPTDVVLGFLFGVDEATVRRIRARVLPVLEALGRDTMRLPDPGKYRRPTLDALLAETPELAIIIDSFEQPIQRPKDRAVADTYYSGKKRRHTRKTQVAIAEGEERFVDLTRGVPGPTADITLLKESGLLARLDPRIGALGDLAYVGIAAVHPAGLGATPRRKPRGQERPPDDVAYNRAFAQRRVPVEHSIRRLRVFACLTLVDRHGQRTSDACTAACAGLVNRHLAAQRTDRARAARGAAAVGTGPIAAASAVPAVA